MKKMYNQIFDEALSAGRNRDYKTAVRLFKMIVSETDEFPQALLYLGRSYHALGEYEKAIQAFQFFNHAVPSSGPGHFFIGRSYLSLGLPKFAIPHLQISLKEDGNKSQNHSLLGLCYLKIRNSALAVEHLEKAVLLAPEDKKIYVGYLNALLINGIKAFHQGDLDLAQEILNFVQEGGNRSILLHLYLGIIAKELGNYDNAVRHLNEAVHKNPQDPTLRYQLAITLFQAGNVEEAVKEIAAIRKGFPQEESFNWNTEGMYRFMAIRFFESDKFRKSIYFAKKVLRLDYQDIDIHLLMGEAFRHLNDFEKAQNHFLRAIEVDKKKIESRYGLAMVLWQQRKWEEMLKQLEIIEKIDPGNKISGYYRALCYCKLNYPAEKTIPSLLSSMDKEEKDPYLMSALGNEYLKADNLRQAEKWLTETLKIDNAFKEAHIGLIKLYSRSALAKKLAAAYRHFLELFPDEHSFRRKYIHQLVGIEKFTDAIKEIHKYLPFADDEPDLQRVLAFCYRKTRKFNEASVIYKQLLKNDPKNENLLRALAFCFERSKKLPSAIYLLERAMKHLKPTPTLLLIQGVLYYKAKELEKALKTFKSVLELNQRDWRALRNIGLIYKAQGLNDFADKFLTRAARYQQDNQKKTAENKKQRS